MSTAEQLAFSISIERRAIHVLLWDDKDDLVRSLLGFLAGLSGLKVQALLVSDDDQDLVALRTMIESRTPIGGREFEVDQESLSAADQFWILFLQQASANSAGPWLNGWRRPISEPPGSMLVIRHADFDSFQRSAPDIASFIGARVYDASTMLSVFSKPTYDGLKDHLPGEIEVILNRLPGAAPSKRDLAEWIKANAPGNR
jgi:hypothetical protein